VNFTELVFVQDTDLPAGDVGMLAGTFNDPGVDMLFQNFVVIQP
jgi:hypothetical protein